MDTNNSLYKFRDWEDDYHKKVITNCELYFGSNFTFNDPFDLQLPVILVGDRAIDEETIKNEYLKTTGKSLHPLKAKSIKNKWRQIQKSNPGIPKQYEEKMTKLAKSVEDRLGIYCMAKHYNNTLLWGHYANSHKGFCICYNKEKLIKYIESKFANNAMFKDVDYSEEIPKLDLGKIEFMPTHQNNNISEYSSLRFSTKHTDWKYENEYRILIDGFKNKALTIPENLIEGVIFGINMLDDHKVEIASVVNEYSNVKMFQAAKNKSKFEIEIQEL